MKYLFTAFAAAWLTTCVESLANQTPENPTTRSDSMVDTGEAQHPGSIMRDPEQLQKIELRGKRLEEMREALSRPRNYSEISTPELLKTVLESTGNDRFREDLNELSKRPEETKEAVDEFLKDERNFNRDPLLISILPAVAKALGEEYHTLIIKRILDQPSARKYDEILLEDKSSSMPGGGLLNQLAAYGNNETGTLDKLIAEGRVEKGSEFETRWRKKLSGREQREQGRQKRRPIADNDITNGRPENTPERGNDASGKRDSSPWSLIIPGGVFLGILLIVLKTFKRKSAS